MLPPAQNQSSKTDLVVSCVNNEILTPEDVTSESMTSAYSDIGYGGSEEGYLPDCYQVELEGTQTSQGVLSLENISPDDASTVISSDDLEEYGFNPILCQFDEYFRKKLDSELQTFQESMHAMLSEQQIHIQRIMQSAATYSTGELYENNYSRIPNYEMKSSLINCSCQDSGNKAKTSLMLELLSLSCQLGALLSLPKFS